MGRTWDFSLHRIRSPVCYQCLLDKNKAIVRDSPIIEMQRNPKPKLIKRNLTRMQLFFLVYIEKMKRKMTRNTVRENLEKTLSSSHKSTTIETMKKIAMTLTVTPEMTLNVRPAEKSSSKTLSVTFFMIPRHPSRRSMMTQRTI